MKRKCAGPIYFADQGIQVCTVCGGCTCCDYDHIDHEDAAVECWYHDGKCILIDDPTHTCSAINFMCWIVEGKCKFVDDPTHKCASF